MNKRRWIVHPFLFALFPVLALFEFNVDELLLRDAVMPVAVVLALTAFVLVGLRSLLKSWDQAAAITALLMLTFFSYGHIDHAIANVMRSMGLAGLRHRYLIPLLGLVVAAVVVLIARGRREFPKVTTLLNVVGGVLVLLSVFRIGAYQLQARAAFQEVETSAAAETDESMELVLPDSPRDIWYLVFDRYGSNITLKEWYDYDNREFLDGLRQRGFTIDDDAFANYPKTLLSICSALNMRYHGATAADKSQYRSELEYYRASTLLKGLGYKYYHFGSWHQPMRSAPNADEVFSFQALPSEFSMVLYRQTPVMPFFSRGGNRREIRAKFSGLESIAQRPGPKYVFAHFICPHPPYVFGSDGGPPTSERQRDRYRDQMIYLNQLINHLVDEILAKSEVAPVIILTADEGPLVYEADGLLDESLTLDESTVGKLQKRARILFAAHMPDASDTVWQDAHSPVNHFRTIFNTYFEGEMEILPDRAFFWPHPSPGGEPDSMSEPFEFVDITEHLAPAK